MFLDEKEQGARERRSGNLLYYNKITPRLVGERERRRMFTSMMYYTHVCDK
jgi:hypothetical protein